jgi:HSP20 family molecular chaperone IbpA
MMEVYLRSDFGGQNKFSSEENPVFTVDGQRWRLVNRPHAWRPPTDLYETEQSIVIRIEIAGVKENDFNITLRNQRLLVTGIRSDVSERRSYHQMEIPFGEFAVEIEIPYALKYDQILPIYQDGFLRITLPKINPTIHREET